MTLAKLKVGETGKVKSVEGEGLIAKRLMEMGVIPGVSIRVVKKAAFGCPIEIRVKGYNLALRENEADSIKLA